MTSDDSKKPHVNLPEIDRNDEASFICPCCTGAGCRGNNGRVEQCEECDGEGSLADHDDKKRSELDSKDSSLARSLIPGRQIKPGDPSRKRRERDESEFELDL